MTQNVKLVIEYDGSNYHGWQSQNNALAISDVITSAIKKLTGEEVKLTGTSRTDAGVHALGQIANFLTESSIPPDRFAYALNTFLPNDIVIKGSCSVPLEFHSRHHAVSKKYRYVIHNDAFPSAIMRSRAWHVNSLLDLGAMQEAAQKLLGTHDFASFKAEGSSVKTTERTIHEVSLRKDEDLISFEIKGDGFLYNMVRIIAGTLVYVGCGKILPNDIPEILVARDRKRAGITAPPHGLYLLEVIFPLTFGASDGTM